jgi:hypothetical protein
MLYRIGTSGLGPVVRFFAKIIAKSRIRLTDRKNLSQAIDRIMKQGQATAWSTIGRW